MGREGRQVKVLRSTDRSLSGKANKVPGARPPTMTPNACLFGFPVKMARPEEKGKHHAALRASALAWRGPKGHMFALPKVSAALGSLGRSDHTPTAERRQAQPSARSPSRANGQTWVPCVARALLAKVREGQPTSPVVLH